MSFEDSDLRDLFESATMRIDPAPPQMHAVHERMTAIGQAYPARRRRHHILVVTGALLTAGAAAGVAGTEAGRSLVRWIFTPIEPVYLITGEGSYDSTSSAGKPVEPSYQVTVPASDEPNSPKGAPDDGWVVGRSGTGAEPFTPQEADATRTKIREIQAISKAGGGRLVGLFEGPGTKPGQTMHTGYSVEYTLKDGRTDRVGQEVTGTQAANLRIDEIMKLRDAGAGQVITQRPFPIGLGRYVIRFKLSDGSTIDLDTNYPPGPRSEREAVFAETRELKTALRFAVENPSANPNGQVWGTLRYKLADGRVVGIVEQVPPEALTPDGKHVAVSQTEPADGVSSGNTWTGWISSRGGPNAKPFTPEEAEATRARWREIDAIQKAGGGRLVGLHERPDIDAGKTIFVAYRVEYTLKDGQTQTIGQGLMGKQAANFRIDEILKLRDAGAGEIISQKPFPIGLGRYTIRFTFSDGSTIDLETDYPPGPRQEREAIMTETRRLKKELRFTVENPSKDDSDGRVWGTLRYKLSDGRVVGITEDVPSEAITPDGKHVAVPEEGQARTAPGDNGG